MIPLTTVLSARIKLRQRHLVEWHNLASDQRKVWALIIEEFSPKISLSKYDKVACYYLQRQKNERLATIRGTQYEKREEMKERHRHEFSLLEESIKVHQLQHRPNNLLLLKYQ